MARLEVCIGSVKGAAARTMGLLDVPWCNLIFSNAMKNCLSR
jgi:hypothetical protein